MNWKNIAWMLRFVIKKKWIWIVSILTIMYFVFLPYQKNLLVFFENLETAKYLFWKSAYLFHNVAVLVFMFHISVQVMNMESFELYLMEKKQVKNILIASFLMYQIWMVPVYIWYGEVYFKSLENLIWLLLTEIANIVVFYIISVKSKKIMIGFIISFFMFLLIFRA